MKKDTKVEVQNGIIGFFDILGYGSFLENNDPMTAAKEVLYTLNSIEQTIVEDFFVVEGKRHVDDCVTRKSFENFFKRLRWLIFSDTILLSLSNVHCEEKQSKEIHILTMFEWLTFFTIAIHLCKKLFDYGLPVRGAIGYGRFAIHGNCFAGIPIIETYKDANNLQLAACVLSESAETELKKLKSKIAKLSNLAAKDIKCIYNACCLHYWTPHKDGKIRQREILNALSMRRMPSIGITDYHSYVLEKFRKHKKTIPDSAQIKLENTVQYFNFIKRHIEDAGGCLVHKNCTKGTGSFDVHS